MTPEEKDKWIALIEGVAAGRQLQFDAGCWTYSEVLDLGESINRYRLKPVEPRSVEGYVFKEAFTRTIENSTFTPQRQLDGQVRVRITEIL